MEKYTIVPGRAAESLAGRDKGQLYMIYSVIDKDFVTVLDGEYKLIAKPKRKRIKHLKLRAEVLEGIADKIAKNAKIFDGEIKSALRRLEQAQQAEKK